MSWSRMLVLVAAVLMAAPAVAAGSPVVTGPIPGAPPGSPTSPVLEQTYPFFSTWLDLAASGYVEEEFYVSGVADAFATDGAKLASSVPYRTRVIVRRPVSANNFNGTVLVDGVALQPGVAQHVFVSAVDEDLSPVEAAEATAAVG